MLKKMLIFWNGCRLKKKNNSILLSFSLSWNFSILLSFSEILRCFPSSILKFQKCPNIIIDLSDEIEISHVLTHQKPVFHISERFTPKFEQQNEISRLGPCRMVRVSSLFYHLTFPVQAWYLFGMNQSVLLWWNSDVFLDLRLFPVVMWARNNIIPTAEPSHMPSNQGPGLAT